MSDFICWEILLRLPAESLFRLRAVCKGWCAVIDDPSFVKAHTKNNQKRHSTLLLRNSTGPPFYPLYSLNFDDVNFTNNGTQTIPATPRKLSRTVLSCLLSFPVAVCNGLMLIALNRDPAVVTLEILNPLTHDRLRLLQPIIKSEKVLGYGFGYDPAADDYKVVIIEENSQTHVHSLKLGSWRKIENFPFDLYNKHSGGHGGPQQGAFFNGALHWISGDKVTKVWDTITVLDLTTEKYHQLSCPPSKEQPHSQRLEALGGCLLLSHLWLGSTNGIRDNIDERRFDIWVMNHGYGTDDSWIKLFSLKGTSVFNQLRLVAYMKNKNGALLQHNNGFSWFNAESNSSKTVSIHGICEYSKKYSAQIFVGSIFRLRDSCGRVASKKQTTKSNTEMKMTAHTKLTLCVRDVEKDHHKFKFNLSHDCCYGYDSNWHNSSSHSVKIRMAPLYPDTNLTTFSVPLDICREIFLRLPAESLIRFRAVCNAWRAVIDDPFFVKAHTNKQLSSNSTNIIIRSSTGPPFYPLYSFNLDDLHFSNGLKRITATPLDFTSSVLSSRLQVLPMATCNGLILIAPISHRKFGYNEISWDWDRKGTWEIWNPLTHERLELPKLDFDSKSGLTAWGLGYDCTTDDYKAVVIGYHYDGTLVEIIPGFPFQEKRKYQTHVYSLKSDSWRRLGNCPCDDWRNVDRSVFLNGVLYWINGVALDLSTEKFRQLKYPTSKTGTIMASYQKQIEVSGGCLIVTEYFHNDVFPVFVLWVMKEDGAQCSWEKLFHIDQDNIDSHIRPVAYMQNKMQILVHNGGHGLYLFDVKSESGRRVSIHGLTGDLYAQVVPKSIFRIHDKCGLPGRKRILKKTGNMKMCDTELAFCVGNDECWFSWCDEYTHDGCYSLDANWYYPSSEDED